MATIDPAILATYAENIRLASFEQEPDSAPIYAAIGYFSEADHPISQHLTSLSADISRSAMQQDWDSVTRGMQAISSLLNGLVDARASGRVEEPTGTPYFSLSKDEERLVLDLAADMRREILAATKFDQARKLRLLKRVAAIEFEVHRPKGRFDVVLGGLNDVGEALGKFGNDVKPIFDRMTEIAKIARGKSSEYDQLPAPDEQKRLPKPDDE